jgi:hypothetical protein
VAARKIRLPPVEPPAVPQGTGEALSRPEPSHDSDGPSRRVWLWPAVLLFAVWCVFLVSLAVRTANPVTLNRAQIRQADLVVEATVDTLASGECRVVRTWPEASQLGPRIVVAGLADLGVRPGSAYLLPLQRNEQGTEFHIAPGPPPLSKPLIYPADDEARRQLVEILGESHTDTPATDN